MATSVTLAQLKTWCRARGELRAPGITDAELVAMINGAIADIHRIILAIDKDRLRTSELISVVSGTAKYALDTTFLQMGGADLLLDSGDDRWCNVKLFDWGKRNSYATSATRQNTTYRIEVASIVLNPVPKWAETNGLRVWFFPTATQLASDSDTWDSVGHWHEYVILKVQWMACAKVDQDPSIFASLLRDMRRDLEASITIDTSEPGRIRDKEAEFSTDEPWALT